MKWAGIIWQKICLGTKFIRVTASWLIILGRRPFFTFINILSLNIKQNCDTNPWMPSSSETFKNHAYQVLAQGLVSMLYNDSSISLYINKENHYHLAKLFIYVDSLFNVKTQNLFVIFFNICLHFSILSGFDLEKRYNAQRQKCHINSEDIFHMWLLNW